MPPPGITPRVQRQLTHRRRTRCPAATPPGAVAGHKAPRTVNKLGRPRHPSAAASRPCPHGDALLRATLRARPGVLREPRPTPPPELGPRKRSRQRPLRAARRGQRPTAAAGPAPSAARPCVPWPWACPAFLSRGERRRASLVLGGADARGRPGPRARGAGSRPQPWRPTFASSRVSCLVMRTRLPEPGLAVPCWCLVAMAPGVGPGP